MLMYKCPCHPLSKADRMTKSRKLHCEAPGVGAGVEPNPGAGVVGLATPGILCFLFFLSFFGAGAILPFLL